MRMKNLRIGTRRHKGNKKKKKETLFDITKFFLDNFNVNIWVL